jgi:hypothetical protein
MCPVFCQCIPALPVRALHAHSFSALVCFISVLGRGQLIFACAIKTLLTYVVMCKDHYSPAHVAVNWTPTLIVPYFPLPLRRSLDRTRSWTCSWPFNCISSKPDTLLPHTYSPDCVYPYRLACRRWRVAVHSSHGRSLGFRPYIRTPVCVCACDQWKDCCWWAVLYDLSLPRA